jgi:hypothetical protein
MGRFSLLALAFCRASEIHRTERKREAMKKQTSGQNAPHGSRPLNNHQYGAQRSRTHVNAHGNVEQRREYLWRRQLELELEMRSLLAQQQALQRNWNVLQGRKATIAGSKPAVALSILLTRHSSMPERNYSYAMQRITQEEQWLLQQGNALEAQKIGVAEQLDVVAFEFTLLDQH